MSRGCLSYVFKPCKKERMKGEVYEWINEIENKNNEGTLLLFGISFFIWHNFKDIIILRHFQKWKEQNKNATKTHQFLWFPYIVSPT